MSWGRRLFNDEDDFLQHDNAIRDAENPWGERMGLPEDTPPAAEPAAPVATTPAPKVETLSVATIEQRLAEDPAWWLEALELEVTREKPRKQALRAIINTAEAEQADPAAIAQARELLETL